ncbi:MAG: hypothetical protein P8Z37_05885 [Acidobacteriota bacterium]
MKICKRYFCCTAVVILMMGTCSLFGQAHFSPGVAGIRDFIVPEPGFYGIVYNYLYTSDRLNDADGNKVDSVNINPGSGPGFDLDLSVNTDIYALAPVFTWVSNWKVAGARYAAYISPTFANSSIRAALSTATGAGINLDGGQFAAGDLFVQPVWLGWSTKHLDAAAGYGFYAPVGKYDVLTYDYPLVGEIKATSPDNIGLGFWTHQIQGSVAFYPWENRGTAATSAWTYEVNGNQKNFDLTPGSYMTWNWGISQYLPITKDQNLIVEAGPSGYSQWQVTDSTGSDARNQTVHDHAHAAGLQAGFIYVPWNFTLNFRYLNEFSTKSRLQGQSFGFNMAVKIR